MYRASFLVMALYILSAVWSGLWMARNWKPDLIHVHFAVPGGPAAWLLSFFLHVPYVLTAHLGDVPDGSPQKTGKWFRWIFPLTPPLWKSAAAVVAVSAYTRSLALKHYPVHIKVIPNGVDMRDYTPASFAPHEPPVLVFAGRLAEQKNPLGLVRVLSLLQDIPWHCILIGDGPLGAAVKAEIDRRGLTHRMTLPGWITPEEVRGWFDQSDILFMPSLAEGMPVVGLQALAMGLALVVSRGSGWDDLVREGQNGLLVDPHNETEMADALSELLHDPEKIAAFRQMSRTLSNEFDIQSVISAYEALFEQVVAA